MTSEMNATVLPEPNNPITWEKGGPLPIHPVDFFKARERKPASLLTVAQIGKTEDPFPLMYEGWVFHQLMDPKERKTCKDHIRLLVCRHDSMVEGFQTTSQWLDFNSENHMLPSKLTDVVTTDDRKHLILGIATALKHLLTLLRAKLLHGRSRGDVEDGKWRELDGRIYGKLKEVKADIAIIRTHGLPWQHTGTGHLTLAQRLRGNQEAAPASLVEVSAVQGTPGSEEYLQGFLAEGIEHSKSDDLLKGLLAEGSDLRGSPSSSDEVHFVQGVSSMVVNEHDASSESIDLLEGYVPTQVSEEGNDAVSYDLGGSESEPEPESTAVAAADVPTQLSEEGNDAVSYDPGVSESEPESSAVAAAARARDLDWLDKAEKASWLWIQKSGALTKALEENKQREELNARIRSENVSFENFSQFFEAEEELFPDIVASRGSGASTPAEESQCRFAQIDVDESGWQGASSEQI